MTKRRIALVVILASFIMLGLIVEDWKDAKVVGIMVGIFLLPLIFKRRE